MFYDANVNVSETPINWSLFRSKLCKLIKLKLFQFHNKMLHTFTWAWCNIEQKHIFSFILFLFFFFCFELWPEHWIRSFLVTMSTMYVVAIWRKLPICDTYSELFRGALLMIAIPILSHQSTQKKWPIFYMCVKNWAQVSFSFVFAHNVFDCLGVMIVCNENSFIFAKAADTAASVSAFKSCKMTWY